MPAGESGFGGTTLIENSYFDYFSKHGLGMTDGNSNATITVSNVEAEQGSPYASQTPFVSYSAGVTASGNSHYYLNCVSTKDTGVIGSTSGTSGVAEAFYTHNNGGADQFALLAFSGCNFGQTAIGGTDACVSLTMDNCAGAGDAEMGAQNKTFTRCKFTHWPPNQNRMDGTLVVKNCLFPLNNIVFNDTSGAVEGTVTMLGNTFDLTNCLVQGGSAAPGIMTRIGATTVTFEPTP